MEVGGRITSGTVIEITIKLFSTKRGLSLRYPHEIAIKNKYLSKKGIDMHGDL